MVELWSHVHGRPHLPIDVTIERSREAKVTKLQGAIVSDEDILQFYVEVCVTCLIVQRVQAPNKLGADRYQELRVTHQKALSFSFLCAAIHLPLSVGAHEREKVAVLAKGEGQEVSHLRHPIDGDGLLLFEAVH